MPLILLGDDLVVLAACRRVLGLAGHDVQIATLTSETIPSGSRLTTANEPTVLSTEYVLGHATGRWASCVVRATSCPTDPKTIALWGRYIGASGATLRNWCRAVAIPAKDSLDFTRMLRVVLHRLHGRFSTEDLLDASDHRTLARLMRMAGNPASLPQSVDEFLERQRWVTRSDVLIAVRRLVSTSRQSA